MSLRLILAGALAALAVPASAAPEAAPSAVVQTKWFPANVEADFEYETAIAEARASKRKAVIVFGADWCHDSRTLAEVLTSDAFKREFGERFVVAFIDVGKPQTGEGRNLDLVERLGVKKLKSTPALFLVAGDGKRLNSPKDAVSWRNADSRGADKILGWFRSLKPKA